MLNFKKAIKERLTKLNLPAAREAEILEELLLHVEDRYQELTTSGLNQKEAARAAVAEVCEGNILIRQLERTERRGVEPIVLGEKKARNFLMDIGPDVRFALRGMRRNPTFSLVAVLTIAVGIGANVLIFSLVERILLSSLPYPESYRLVRLIQAYPENGLATWGLSHATFARLRDGNQSFESFAAYMNAGAVMTGSEKPEYLQTARVTADFFKVFGVNPILGRTFAPDEEKAGKNVVVLSYGLWQRRFGSDSQIVGRWLTIADVPTQVIGVMPASFRFPSPTTEMWLPITLDPQAMHPFMLTGVGRLKLNVSPASATADTTRVLFNAATETPEIISRKAPPPAGAGLKTIVTPMKEYIVGKIERPLLVLQIAVGFVLLIACANVANLLLSRATKRTQEISVRLALGAAPSRIIRQLLTESLLLATFGAALGVTVAWCSLRTVTRLFGQGIPRIDEARITGNVLLATLAATVFTGLLFGSIPALRTYALGLKSGLNDAQRSIAGFANRRLNSSLVVVQLALSLVLLIGASLMLKSFKRLMAINPGFETENVLTMIVPVSPNKGKETVALQFYEKLLENLKSVPGIRNAAITSTVPFSGFVNSDSHFVEGHEPKGEEAPQAHMTVVSPGYFKSMGISLLEGRDFQDSDRDGAPLVALVDETIAHQYFPNGDAIGKRIRTGDPEWYTIIGIVSPVKDQNLAEEFDPHIYFSYQQIGFAYGPGRDQRRMYLVVNTDNPSGIVPSIRERIRMVDQNVPMYAVNTMTEVINKKLESQRLINFLLTSFSVIALLLAAIGTYGVMSLFVSSRASEFAIRGALGATPGSLLNSVLKQGLWLAGLGTLLGLAGSWALTRAIATQLFGVSTTDATIFTGTAILLIIVTVIASYSPARRAARTDPAVVLRNS